MQKHKMCLVLGALLSLLFATVCPADDYLSPVAVVADKDGKTLFVADEVCKNIAVVDVASGKVAKSIALEGAPSGLVLAPDGSALYVTAGCPDGCVYVIDPAAGKVLSTIPAGHSPVAPVASPNGKTLYVCDRFNNRVLVIDLAAKDAKPDAIPVMREPIAAAVTSDGAFLFVANHLPVGSSYGDLVAASVSVVATADKKVASTIQLPNGSTSLRGMCISPDGQNIYLTHILARYQLPTTQLERGWMNTNALSIIDAAGKALVNTVLLDDVDLGAANPWGVTCTADGKYICVAHAGTHEISVIDRAGLHEKLKKVAAGTKVSDASASAADVPNDLSFLVNLRRRLALAGKGPRGIAVIGSKVYAAEYYTGALGIVDTNPEVRHEPKSIPLGQQKTATPVRTGDLFFHDASLCFQKWQSCSSCHPDSRADALNWDLLNDGIGNPKNTRSMLLTHKVPPAMSLGVRDTAEIAVRSGIRYIQFAVRPEEDAVAIDEYLKSLTPVPSPYLVKGKLSEAAQKGKKVYDKAGCAECHPEPLYSVCKQFDIGTTQGMDKGKPVKTPTLIECWRTAPYLNDGRAATLKEVFTKFNPDDKHGKTTKLSPEEMDQLIEYTQSL
ncbi:MAG: YncE family protein [Planctomycetota bacterium]